MPFGLGDGIGAGVALSGTPTQAYAIYRQDQARRLAAQAAEQKRRAEADKDFAIKLNDFMIKNTEGLTPKATPLAMKAFQQLYNDALTYQKDHPNDVDRRFNILPELINKYMPDFAQAKAASEAERDVMKEKAVHPDVANFYRTNYGDYSLDPQTAERLSDLGYVVQPNDKGQYIITGKQADRYDFEKAKQAAMNLPNMYALDQNANARNQNIKGYAQDFTSPVMLRNDALHRQYIDNILTTIPRSSLMASVMDDVAALRAKDPALTKEQAFRMAVENKASLPQNRIGEPKMVGASGSGTAKLPPAITPIAYTTTVTPTLNETFTADKAKDVIGKVPGLEQAILDGYAKIKGYASKGIDLAKVDEPVRVKSGNLDFTYYPETAGANKGGGQIVWNRAEQPIQGAAIPQAVQNKVKYINVADFNVPIYNESGKRVNPANKNMLFTDFVYTTIGGKTGLFAKVTNKPITGDVSEYDEAGNVIPLGKYRTKSGVLSNEDQGVYYVPVSGKEGASLAAKWQASSGLESPIELFRNTTGVEVKDQYQNIFDVLNKKPSVTTISKKVEQPTKRLKGSDFN